MKKILVVDDSQDILTSLTDLLEESGYYVLTAGNSQSALRIMQENIPDLILCDIVMPELTGYDLLSEIKKNTMTMNIPFIFISAQAEKMDVKKGLNAGADEYLTKPFDSVALLGLVERMLIHKVQVF